MKILVFNSGSSSVKCQLFVDKEMHFKGHIDGIGLDSCKLLTDYNFKESEKEISAKDHKEAIKIILDELVKSKIINHLDEIDAIGHRVVHGGERYHESTMIDDKLIKDVEELSEFAPLHNPPNLLGIKACKEALPNKPQVAVFDTSFHAKIPKKRFVYAIPYKYYEQYKIRKYGFHGTSYRYITEQIEEKIGKDKKLVICHIGNGSSVCAVENGKSVDTSMGFTPLQGVVMGTRCGDIDPELVEFIGEKEKINAKEVIKILNKQSGLKGLSGDSDMRKIWTGVNENKERDILALDILSESIAKYVAYYIALLNGIDAIIFTAGLGVKAFYLREKILKNFEYMGIKLDIEKNEKCEEIVSTEDSSVKVFVIPTNEELMIAKDTEKIIRDN